MTPGHPLGFTLSKSQTERSIMTFSLTKATHRPPLYLFETTIINNQLNFNDFFLLTIDCLILVSQRYLHTRFGFLLWVLNNSTLSIAKLRLCKCIFFISSFNHKYIIKVPLCRRRKTRILRTLSWGSDSKFTSDAECYMGTINPLNNPSYVKRTLSLS